MNAIKITLCLSFFAFVLLFHCQAAVAQTAIAQTDEEVVILSMFFKEGDLVVSATRHEKPVSQVSENITVVTAEEIEEFHAHTLVEVLNIITGLQLEITGSPGTFVMPRIQGSDFRHVLVLIDGVSLNNLSDNLADISAIPVQSVERIEIIKGPASSTWGSSLGGVINIITKSTGESLKSEGTVSASFGERNTGDLRVDIAGKEGVLGYYLYGGTLQSDGFNPNNSVSMNNFYSKLDLNLSDNTDLVFTLGHNSTSRGIGEFSDYDLSYDAESRYTFSTLSLNSALNEKAELSFSLRKLLQDNYLFISQLSTGEELQQDTYKDDTMGCSLTYTRRHESHTIVIGSDYDYSIFESSTISDDQKLEKWAVFANDSIIIADLSVTPGLRYDDTNTSGDFISPSLGVNYALGESSVLRADLARGFNLPPVSYYYGNDLIYNPNPDLKMEQVWSYQAGIESSALKYLRFKATAFLHDAKDAIVTQMEEDGTYTKVNEDRVRRQGVEVEIETNKIYDVSLKGGVVLQETRDPETDEELKNIPTQTYDISLKYDDGRLIKALLTGHYIWWNAESLYGGDYDSIIWDINITATLPKPTEFYLAVHNILDESQYFDEYYKNPGRWVEAGIRYKF
jgi:vitamin B12 transporter